MRKVNKVLCFLGAVSVLLELFGVAVILCAGFMVESGDFSAVIKTAALGAAMCVPMAVLECRMQRAECRISDSLLRKLSLIFKI